VEKKTFAYPTINAYNQIQIMKSKSIVIGPYRVDRYFTIYLKVLKKSLANTTTMADYIKLNITRKLIFQMLIKVLMYYNMGSIASDSLNSINDRKIVSKYLESLKLSIRSRGLLAYLFM
jgi:hypothetical protein